MSRWMNGRYGVNAAVAALLLTAATPPPSRAAILAEDDGSQYGAGWTNGSNGGTGFGAWQFIIDPISDGTLDIGDPAEAGITGMDANSFRLSSTNGYVNARRAFAQPLQVGDVFSLQWGNHWDTGGGYKGINLRSLGNQLLYINMGPEPTISISGQPMFTNFGTAAITFHFEYTAADTLRVFATGRDGVETYDESLSVSGAPDEFVLFAGDLSSEGLANRRPFINHLRIEGSLSPQLALAGREGMVAGRTNPLAVRRTGPTDDPLVVALASDAPSIAAPADATVTIPAGASETETEVIGMDRGSATLTASAAGFADVQTDIEVYDLAYDSSSYYAPGSWTNGSNGGDGFLAWELDNNDGDQGGGVTNYAGAFLGDSTAYGGGNVNTPAGDAFGLYANSTDSANPQSSATRLLQTFPVGARLSFDLGVNYRNGSKGARLQRNAMWLFEVAVRDDDYVYADWGAGDTDYTSLGWSYAADTAIQVVITRYPNNRYTVALDRTGDIQDYMLIETEWKDLGGLPPDRVQFYTRDNEPGGENNLYVNRLGMNLYHYLEMEGVVNIDIGGATTVHLRRSDTNGPLTVALASAAETVAAVPATAEFADGEARVHFTATGVSESLVHIHAEAPGYVAAPLLVNVFPFPSEWDNAGNYIPGLLVPATFVDGANEGGGFEPWTFVTAGTALIDLDSFVVPDLWFDSVNNRSFRLLGGSDGAYAEAGRTLATPLAPGDRFSAVLGVDWSGGHRGIDIRDAADLNLFNFNLSGGDTYSYTFGANPPVNLDWAYNNHSAILVEVEQLINDQLRVTLTRDDGEQAGVFSDNLTAPMARVLFYNGDHDADPRQALYVNDLLVTRAGSDGPPIEELDVSIVNIGGIDYTRAAVHMGIGANGTTYHLEYTTDLTATPVVWTPVDTQIGDGENPVELLDDNQADPLRIYRVRTVEPFG
jgi:hypothetical protein